MSQLAGADSSFFDIYRVGHKDNTRPEPKPGEDDGIIRVYSDTTLTRTWIGTAFFFRSYGSDIAPSHGLTQPSKNMQNFLQAVKLVRDILKTDDGKNDCASFFGGMGESALQGIVNYVQRAGDRAFRSIGGNDSQTGTGIRMNQETTYADTRPMMSIPGDGSPPLGVISPGMVTINTDGAFVRNVPVRAGASLPLYGGYRPGTLASRVTQLLHEMGHLE